MHCRTIIISIPLDEGIVETPNPDSLPEAVIIYYRCSQLGNRMENAQSFINKDYAPEDVDEIDDYVLEVIKRYHPNAVRTVLLTRTYFNDKVLSKYKHWYDFTISLVFLQEDYQNYNIPHKTEIKLNLLTFDDITQFINIPINKSPFLNSCGTSLDQYENLFVKYAPLLRLVNTSYVQSCCDIESILNNVPLFPLKSLQDSKTK